MASSDDVRRLALSLPETVELDHHGRPSFRVAGRIFATRREACQTCHSTRSGVTVA